MNHIYRSIWSDVLGTWIAVAENTKTQGKHSSTGKPLFVASLLLCSTTAWALPTGEQLIAGQATVSVPTANLMQIQQSSQKAVLNWQGFSIAPNEVVNIQQPNATSALLNRVVGQDASQIQGRINANGQVYLVNPNGVVFSKTTQVDVGGLVATTHNIKDQDFLNGNNHFTQDNSTSSVENQGTINTPEGGVVALIGQSVTNTGTINTPKGTTALTAGKTVDLDFKGDGLVEVKVSEATLNAQITNKGAIQADGGRVVLTAKAAGQLIDTVINQEGIIRAQGLVERNGEIILDGGDSGVTQVSGTLNADSGASNTTGGKISVTGEQVQINNGAVLSASGDAGGVAIVVGDKQNTQQTTVQQDAIITAKALNHGTAGTINVFANMNNGMVKVAGKLDASAPKNGDGGFIDTSAAHVKIADTAKVTTKANNGKSGTWLIDPSDFTIAASGGDMTGALLSASLAAGNVNILSSSGASGVNGDVNVNDVVSWGNVVASNLTLNAQRNININANMNGGIVGSLSLRYGQASAAGGASDNYFIGKNVSVNLPAGANFSTQKGSAGTVVNYTVITSLGAQGSVTGTDLQGMKNSLTTNYALGANIDATLTSGWNAGAGFQPVGNSITGFSGNFDGLGHTITGLTINRPADSFVGLFGSTNSNGLFTPIRTPSNTISNLGLIGGSVVGNQYVGGVVGANGPVFSNGGSIINNVYNTGSVTGAGTGISPDSGDGEIGGLVGRNAGVITNAYTTGVVSGNAAVGGLVGFNFTGTISNTYATGNVSGTFTGNNRIGGLVGWNNDIINNSYATGSVSGDNTIGGLCGLCNGPVTDVYATGNVTGINEIGGLAGFGNSLTNVYATGRVSGTGTRVGGVAGASNAIANSFWDIQSSGQSIGVGFVGVGFTAAVTGVTTAQLHQMNTFTGWNISNTGGSSAIWRIYEGNTAPLLRSFLTPLTANTTISKTYTGQVHNPIANVSYSTAPITATVDSTHLFSTATPYGNAINVGSYPLTGLYSDQQGYDISLLGTLNITPAPLTIAANPFSKTYDALAFSGGNGVTYTGLVNGETSSVLTGTIGYGGNSQGAINAGTYDLIPNGLSSGNYNISYVNSILTIDPAELTLVSSDISKFYDGSILGNGSVLIANGRLFGLDTLSGGIFLFTNPNIGINKTVTLNNVFINDGNGGKNYRVTYINNNNSRIVPNIFHNSPFLLSQIAPLQASTNFLNGYVSDANESNKGDTDNSPSSDISANDSNNSFSGSPSNALTRFITELTNEKKPILPVLQIKNTAGQVKRLRLSKDRQFLSLLQEDGSVRIWDFQSGVQRQIIAEDKKQTVTDISAVDDKGEALSIASKIGFGSYDVTSLSTNEQDVNQQPDLQHFTSSDDGSLLLINTGNELKLWDNKQKIQLWQSDYKRGAISHLALSHDKQHGAVLSTQAGVYELAAGAKKLKPLTDALDIIDLNTGKVIKSLPNTGEQVVYLRFKDDKTLQVGLAGGKLFDWNIVTGDKKTVANFPETVVALDNDQETYAYVAKNGGVRVSDGQDHIHLSIENKDNPFKFAQLLDGGKKLLTVLASGDLSLWDVASGEKLLRLFSTKQGWTVMDALGRFDGSEEAMDNFSWLANEEDIPLDHFSENYYEPGLLSNVIQNQDYLNNNPDKVVEGISLPPKVELQLAEQQSQDDKVSVKLNVYNRSGGINQVNIYHNGKIIRNENEKTQAEENTEHFASTLNITPTAGKNTVKVVASNDMDIENNSTEISFDGKTKAYTSSVRLLTVGIDQYSDRQLNLLYSVADADSIGKAFKNQAKITASENLTDDKATKPKILAELRKLSQGMQQDTLVIYFAGHGIAVDKEWYFLPFETKLKPTPEQIAESGITATELGNIFKDSKIQRIMLMVDSCYSGASLDAFKFKKQQNSQRHFARKMSRNLGITIIAATSKDQEASELDSLGHGLFTYAMTEELQKKDITAHSIAASIVKTLPAFSKKVLGFTQDPAVYTKGSDFMLTDFGDDKK